MRPGAIQRRVVCGRLHRLHMGVYAVGHKRLSTGGGGWPRSWPVETSALLSHRSAAAALGAPRTGLPTEPTSRQAGRRGPSGIALHRSRRIHDEDRAVRDGIPVTSVARTLLDLAEVVRTRLLSRAIEDAERQGIFDLVAVQRLIARSRGRHGLRELRARSPTTCHRSSPARSSSAVPGPCAGIPGCRRPGGEPVGGSGGRHVWPRPPSRSVELDSREYHRSRAAFERDRLRDTTLQLAGYRVLRITHRRLLTEPGGVVRAIRSLLDRV